MRFRHDGVDRKFNPRIVIAADGRNSVVARKSASISIAIQPIT